MRLVVLISGSGTNLQAVIDACHAGKLPAEIVAVVSNKRNAFGLTRAASHNIPTVYFPFKPYRDREQTRTDYDADLAQIVQAFRPDLVVLAGWMHILSPAFLDHFTGRVINLHPALPGQFAGTNAIERAYNAYQQGEISYSGVMVHVAIPEVDAGETITQSIVPIKPDDTLESFAERMHMVEHMLIVQSIALMCRRK